MVQCTKNQLKQYNGKNGNRCYVAIEGIVYDVADSDLWQGGKHIVCPGAVDGQGLTELYQSEAPETHQTEHFRDYPAVGKLVD